MDIYSKAQDELNNFINKNLSNYARDRNYDYGPENRSNTSVLSKYISHRILIEYDIINRALLKYPISTIDKYIQEIFWRIYWKGWLEHRPQVWNDYYNFQPTNINIENLDKATTGNTGIECFDAWVLELKKYNYLHNHTRMWFASIWIFTLKLPWQLGANFFMKYLLDGDSASNTLSWRWVAGLQTVGKNYLATSSNIHKYTNGRFSPVGLNEHAECIKDISSNSAGELNITKSKQSSSEVIILDNDLSFNDRKDTFNKYKIIYLLHLSNHCRRIKLSDNVLKFKYSCLTDFSKEFNQVKIVDETEIEKVLNKSKSIDVIYPCIGENLSFLEANKNKCTLNYTYRSEDLFCWKYAKKGFFNFKKNIPLIIQRIFEQKDLFS